MNEDKIVEILKKQEETLNLVEKLWRAEKWRRFLAVFKYIIYIGVILGAFYFLTPYIDRAIALIQEFRTVKNPQGFQKFLENLKLK